MSYYLAPSLDHLRDEVNTRWPKRSTASDGWIGDTSHSARKSDHNPDYSAGGVVRALDITAKGVRPLWLVRRLKKDDRVYYIIFNGFIYSRTHGFAKRAYHGSNQHHTHIHVSIREGREHENAMRDWLPSFRTYKTRGKRVERALTLVEQAVAKASRGLRRKKLRRARRVLRNVPQFTRRRRR